VPHRIEPCARTPLWHPLKKCCDLVDFAQDAKLKVIPATFAWLQEWKRSELPRLHPAFERRAIRRFHSHDVRPVTNQTSIAASALRSPRGHRRSTSTRQPSVSAGASYARLMLRCSVRTHDSRVTLLRVWWSGNRAQWRACSWVSLTRVTLPTTTSGWGVPAQAMLCASPIAAELCLLCIRDAPAVRADGTRHKCTCASCLARLSWDVTRWRISGRSSVCPDNLNWVSEPLAASATQGAENPASAAAGNAISALRTRLRATLLFKGVLLW